MQKSAFAPSLIYINMPEVILIPKTTAHKNLQAAFMTSLIELNIPHITAQHLIEAIHVVLTATNQTMPYHDVLVGEASKAQKAIVKKAREKFVIEILQSIAIDFSCMPIRYLFEGKDITARVTTKVVLETIEHRQTWMNGISEHLARILETQTVQRPIAFIAADPRRLTADKINPVIGLLIPDHQPFTLQDGRELRLRKRADAIIPLSTDIATLKNELTKVITAFTELREQDAQLRNDLNEGRIKLERQFERDTWPGYALMTHVKKEVRSIVQEVIENNTTLCDPLDLEYQTLFRLTSLPISAVFEKGEVLETYLQEQNAYAYWRDILTLDPHKVAHPIKTPLVRKIVDEQLLIIRDRMQGTTLPLDKLLGRQGIFAEPGWKLQKNGGNLAAIKIQHGEGGDTIVGTKKVAFKPVDIGYAKELHSVLHYIHGPRATKAFGLYLEDDPLPFSVVAFDEIDRPYKKELLFMHGYDPSKCLDLARLYSRPGTPFNTSSTIFTLAFTYFKENMPEVQAVLSAFMPTYAHGMSMISAGFNYGVLVKEWRHSFAERDIDGQKAWELVTKRRIDDKQTTIDSQWPLLPVFELMASLQPPRFTPFSELKGMMVSKDL
jgi:hypothetical protein